TAPPLPPNQQKIAGWVNSKPAMVGQNKVGVDNSIKNMFSINVNIARDAVNLPFLKSPMRCIISNLPQMKLFYHPSTEMPISRIRISHVCKTSGNHSMYCIFSRVHRT
ncbi:hypothetical protein, partial [Brevibacillus aydinogluensis]|uniref:hypothetical protein n=1 Tax=Brevibacillus aydinogluensis TaxID=927786 RepID=UPI002892CBCF